MKIGDLLLLKGYINKKQLTSALSKQANEAINYDRSVPLGKVLIEEGHITVEEVAEALNDQQIHKPIEEKEVEPMAHKIGENTAFQMDLKFLVTIGVVLVSAVGVYFTLTGAVEDNTKEINNIKSMGDLKIISYKLDEYDETFKDLKNLSTQLMGRYRARGIDINYVIFGHIHSARVGDNFSRSSSMVGANDYSEKALNLSGRASQNCYIFYDNGNRDGIKVDLQNYTNDMYDIEKSLESYNAKSHEKLNVGKTIFKVVV